MKKQILMLLCCAAVLSVNPVFAMEERPDEAPKGLIVVQALPDDGLDSPINTLPPEKLADIFSFVSSRSELIRYSWVSKKWNEVVEYALSRIPYSLFVMGDLGAGNSTLVHLLAGKQLNVKYLQGACDWQFSCPDPLPNVTIWHGMGTGTQEPIEVLDLSHQRVIWDCPSFSENLGEEKDFANAQKIHSLLTGDIKVICSIAETSFTNRAGAGVIQTIARLTEIFPDQNQLQALLTLVITKRGVFTSGSPLELLQKTMNAVNRRHSRGFSDKGRALLQHLIDNPSRVIDFPVPPMQDGPYVISESLMSLINNQTYVSNPQVNAPTKEGVAASRWNTER